MRRSKGSIPSATMELYAPGLPGSSGKQRMPQRNDLKPQKARSFFFPEDEPSGFGQDSAGFAWMAEGDSTEAELSAVTDQQQRQQQQQQQQHEVRPRPARSAGRRRADRSSSASRAQPRPQSAPMLASVATHSSFSSTSTSGASSFGQMPAAAIVEVPSTVVSQRDAVRAGTQRLAMHRLKKQQTEKRRVQDLQEYARAQRRQLVASIRLANDCCRILKRPVTYGISEDPTKKGLFDLETPSTLQMRVIVRQQGPSQYGWKTQGDAHYREISAPLFQKELDGLQREAADEEQRRREATQLNPEQSSAGGPDRSSGQKNAAASASASASGLSNSLSASRWQPHESEEELREFIHQTVELASTLLEQTATLKKKAGPGKSFNPYAAGTARG